VSRRRPGLAALAAAGLALLAACADRPEVPEAAPAGFASASTSSSGFHRSGTWIVDAQQRVVVLHGFNLIRKTPPYYPSRFGEQDARFLAEQGFTAARIGFIWAAVEPRPGVYDDAYIRRIVALNELLARYGIHTVIDFHQDSWGEALQQRGDGAPQWATLADTADGAFARFWDDAPAADGVGIQSHFIAAWQHVVPMLDRSPASGNIIGLDPFNEPYPGTAYPPPCTDFAPCPAFEQGPLAAFYRRVIGAIRASGDRHLILPEGIAQNAQQAPSLPAADDAQTAFNWHFYCQSLQKPNPARLSAEQRCAAEDDKAFGNLDDYSRALGLPWLVTEFGAGGTEGEFAHQVDLMARRFLPWTYWMYYSAMEDPANDPKQGIVADDRSSASLERNVRREKLDALSIPYAQAIAGWPQRTRYDRASRVFVLDYQPRPGDARTQIFVPQRLYPRGYQVQAEGADAISAPGATWLLLVARPGAAAVSVKLSPLASPS
jgi:endoglycosylceramidase